MSTKKISRRKFVQLAGATALIGADMWEQAALADGGTENYKTNLAKFDYVVVLMLENRSFDNMLGYLYQNNPTKSFNGVYGKPLSNPIPSFANRSDLGVVPVMQGVNPENPSPDPGEEYPHVNTQLFGSVALTNRDATAAHFLDVFSRAEPRPRTQWPQTIPRKVERPSGDDTLQLPLNQLQSSIFKTVQTIAKQQGLNFPDVATIGEALFHMKSVLPNN